MIKRLTMILILILLVFCLAGSALAGAGDGSDVDHSSSDSEAAIDPASAEVDLAEQPENVTLTATTEVSETFTGTWGNIKSLEISDGTDYWSGAVDNGDGDWSVEPDYEEVQKSGKNSSCTITGTWVSTATFDPYDAGTGEHEIDYSVTFDVNKVTTNEKDLVKTIEVEAETAVITVTDSRECFYSSENIKGYREAPGIVNFILKDLGYFGKPCFSPGEEDPGYAGLKGSILSGVAKSFKDKDLGDRKDDYDAYIESVYFSFYGLF